MQKDIKEPQVLQTETTILKTFD